LVCLCGRKLLSCHIWIVAAPCLLGMWVLNLGRQNETVTSIQPQDCALEVVCLGHR
jgi:hypothetical protein